MLTLEPGKVRPRNKAQGGVLRVGDRVKYSDSLQEASPAWQGALGCV